MRVEVSGSPTAEEVAAVVAVLAAVPAGAPGPEPAPPSRWNDRAALLRTPLPHGLRAWGS